MMPSEPWQEPELADIKPGITGYPLGSMPPNRLLAKAEKKTNGNTGNGIETNGSHEDSADSRSSPRPSTPFNEQKFKIKLKSSLFDSLVSRSKVRRSQRAKDPVNYYSRKGSSDDETPPPKVEDEGSRNNGSTKRRGSFTNDNYKNKKIKISTPKKPPRENPFGYGPPPDLAGQARASNNNNNNNSSEDDPAKSNNDYCSTCGGSGIFLCCETCPRSFHFTCVDPPLDEDSLPEGEWTCTECYTLRHPPLPFKNGIFSQMMNQLVRRNPRQFGLPKGIRDRFEGVYSNDLGEYEYAAPSKKQAIKPKADTVDDLSNKLVDKNGEPILCFICNKSALTGVQIVACEECSSNFHVDCLDPPLDSAGAKWRCPNHAEQIIKLPRRPRNSLIKDANLTRGFKNNGLIEVLDSEDEDPEEFVQHIPPLFESYDTAQGISAPIPTKVLKSFAIDDVIYRLPQQSIKLDFIEAVHEKIHNDPYPETNNTQILVALDELATRPKQDQEAVRDLCYLQTDGTLDSKVASGKRHLSTLIDIALKTLPQPRSQPYPLPPPNQQNFNRIHTPPHDNNSIDIDDDVDEDGNIRLEENVIVSPEEKLQLLALKKLMDYKGKDEIMKFLISD